MFSESTAEAEKEPEVKLHVFHKRAYIWDHLPKETVYERIVQQYLQSEESIERRVRFKTKFSRERGQQFIIEHTRKENTDVNSNRDDLLTRDQTDEQINQAVFQRLRTKQADPQADLIIKNRFVFPAAIAVAGVRPDIEIDIFWHPKPENAQIILAEIELEEPLDNMIFTRDRIERLLPSWLRKFDVVTTDSGYKNINIASGSLT